jgi:hypothetical protein
MLLSFRIGTNNAKKVKNDKEKIFSIENGLIQESLWVHVCGRIAELQSFHHVFTQTHHLATA